jgi:threonine dehydratase
VTPVAIAEINQARERLAGVVLQTPLQPFIGQDVPAGNHLWLKTESLQRTGSFKIRGAYNAIAGMDDAERRNGVITYSSGNHGQAVACAAHLLGVRAVVVMPEDAVIPKVLATRRWGAEVTFAGHTSLDREARAGELAAEHGYAIIPPFDDPRIIAGQGTAGLEILEQLPDLEAVVVPVGGGGLISGIASAVRALRRDVTILGVEPEGGADARESLATGTLVTWDAVNTVADGLRTSRIGKLNLDTIQETVDDIVTVTDDEILRAVGILAADAHLVTEPSGAVAVASVLFGRTPLHDARIVAVISGGNVDPARLCECLRLSSAHLASSASTRD